MRRTGLLGGTMLAGAMVCLPVSAFAQEAPAATAPAPQDAVPLLSPENMPAQPDSAAPAADPVDFATSYPEGDRLVYTPQYFARFSPRSALDMLNQLPGFAVDRNGPGAQQARGLGQATGNVLLNGQRIASKSDSVADQVARIAAADVVRIELVDGSTLNVPGLSGRVANIVARASSKMSGRFEWEPQWHGENSDTRWQSGTVSVNGTHGRATWSLALTNNAFLGGSIGTNLIGNGLRVTEERLSDSRNSMQAPRLNSTVGFTTPGGMKVSLRGSYQRTWSKNHEFEDTFAPVTVPPWNRRITGKGHGYNYELGGELEFALGPGSLNLIALESYRDAYSFSQSVVDPATGAPPLGSQFESTALSGEHIGRAEYSWPMLGGDWQLSGEAAFNRLNKVSALRLLAPDGVFNPVPYPSGTGRVTESRYDVSLTQSRALTGTLSLQLTLGSEFSSISQSGSTARTRSFARPKGLVSLAWKPTHTLDLSFKLQRKVGQLEFSDFLAEVNLQNSNANDGNAELRPQQSWEAELQATQNFGSWGTLTAKLFDYRITDYVTIVPLSRFSESTGNIASARERGVTFNGTLRLDPAGLKGMKLDLTGDWRESRLADPLTGETRGFDNYRPHNWEVALRHDVPGTQLAWGSSFRSTGFGPYYRLAEQGLDYNLKHNLRVFIEHKDVFGLTVQLRWNNILEQPNVRARTLYAGPRNSGPILFTEYRDRAFGSIFNMTVKGSF